MILRLLAAGVAVIATTVVHADSMRVVSRAGGEVRSVTVYVGDLGLDREAGARRFLDRIAAAARRVCQADEIRDLARDSIVRHCLRDTMDRTVSSVPSANVRQLYADDKADGKAPGSRIATAH